MLFVLVPASQSTGNDLTRRFEVGLFDENESVGEIAHDNSARLEGEPGDYAGRSVSGSWTLPSFYPLVAPSRKMIPRASEPKADGRSQCRQPPKKAGPL